MPCRPEAEKLAYGKEVRGANNSVNSGSYAPVSTPDGTAGHNDPVESYTFMRPADGSQAGLTINSVTRTAFPRTPVL